MNNRKSNHKINKLFTSKTNIIYFIMFVLLTCVDQWSKQIAATFLRGQDIILIPGILELHYLENKGAAWGILQNKTWILLSITVIVLIVIAFVFCKLPDIKKFRLLRFCLVLLASGALGNFIDRIVNHYVIDFIYFSLINFPVFNFADCFVCISAILILYCTLFKYKDEDFLSNKKIQNSEEVSDGTNYNTTGNGE